MSALRSLYDEVAADPLLLGVKTRSTEAVDDSSPAYGIPNPQAKVCHKMMEHMATLHKIRDVAAAELEVDNLGFYDVEELEDLIASEMDDVNAMADLITQARPEVLSYPVAPSIDWLYDKTSGTKLVNFGSGFVESNMPGTVGYDPQHIHFEAGTLSQGAEHLNEQGWLEAKSDNTVGVISRNVVMHLDHSDDFSVGPSAHIVPNYERWVESQLAVPIEEEADVYRVGSLMTAQMQSVGREFDWKSKAAAFLDLGMFLAIYFFPKLNLIMQACAEVPIRVPRYLPSLASPGDDTTESTETEFTPKMDGKLLHFIMEKGFATLVDMNRNVYMNLSVGTHMHVARLLFELVEHKGEKILYLLGGHFCGVRLPPMQRVLESFVAKVKLSIPGHRVSSKPPLRGCKVPIDGVIGANFARRHVHYYKSMSNIEFDINFGQLKDINSPFHKGTSGYDKNLRGLSRYGFTDEQMVKVRFTQLVVDASDGVVPVPCLQLEDITLRDKSIPDSEEKIRSLVVQPRAEEIVQRMGIENPFPQPPVIQLTDEMLDAQDAEWCVDKILDIDQDNTAFEECTGYKPPRTFESVVGAEPSRYMFE